MIYPSYIPVMHGKSKLAFGFNYDASNPPFEHYWLRFYAADGSFVGQMRWRKDFRSAPGPGEVLDRKVGVAFAHFVRVTGAQSSQPRVAEGLEHSRRRYSGADTRGHCR